jgi:hypothetical protein
MSKRTVIFELFGKKMKTTVDADNDEQAKYLVLGKISQKVKFTEIQNVNESKETINGMGEELFNKLFG